ncbi:monocarboxylate transporter 2-like [Sitophilus oryzae]|uniref:Monocarboxylate transporter 2-like n=1 Tax=Sitophilus oryzae TaxID=7048 RepID=A0A6J2XR26_SITOR|nr:monocarboxylate transporter 2-like [Sitophilus oryzae]
MSTRISLHSKISRVPSNLKLRLTKSSFNPEEFEGAIVVIPPDGGWGWCIVLAGLVCLFCADGSAYCFGIFLDDISKEFKCKVTDVALVSSISGGFYYITGPITCAAVNRYGFRVIGVLGGFLTAISFFSASFTNDIKPFLVLIGIGAGTGYNFIYSASVIAVSFYFERWRAMAMAATCCGSSLGLVGFPPIMTLLLKQYSWRLKFQVISASFVVCGVLSFLYRPIKSTRYETDSTRVPSVGKEIIIEII